MQRCVQQGRVGVPGSIEIHDRIEIVALGVVADALGL